MTPAYPALAAVLAALTSLPAEVWEAWPSISKRLAMDERGVRLIHIMNDGFPAMGPTPWIATDPAEAWEILDARGLLPSEGARAFWCGACDGAGCGPFEACYREPGTDAWTGPTCTACRGERRADHPTTVPDLVAWASLGAEAIVTAEMRAREVAPAIAHMGYVCGHAERVTWHVVTNTFEESEFLITWREYSTGASLHLNGTFYAPRSFVTASPQTIVPARQLWDAGLPLGIFDDEYVLYVPTVGSER